ncbi:hypothetical protein V1512DRAFT_251935 [Lipomyces arxii]|uniref:uncharacterized protein n=1 Tax=Lipomyces arxii TaxID=56418 RepID=UPI0034CF5CB6
MIVDSLEIADLKRGYLEDVSKQMGDDSIEANNDESDKDSDSDSNEDETESTKNTDERTAGEDQLQMSTLKYSQTQTEQNPVSVSPILPSQDTAELQVRATQSTQPVVEHEYVSDELDDNRWAPTQQIDYTQTQPIASSTQLAATQLIDDSTQLIVPDSASPVVEVYKNQHEIEKMNLGDLFVMTPEVEPPITPTPTASTPKIYIPFAQSQERRKKLMTQQAVMDDFYDNEFKSGQLRVKQSRQALERLRGPTKVLEVENLPDQIVHAVQEETPATATRQKPSAAWDVQPSPFVQVPRTDGRKQISDHSVIRDSEEESSPILTGLRSKKSYSTQIINVPSSEPRKTPFHKHSNLLPTHEENTSDSSSDELDVVASPKRQKTMKAEVIPVSAGRQPSLHNSGSTVPSTAPAGGGSLRKGQALKKIGRKKKSATPIAIEGPRTPINNSSFPHVEVQILSHKTNFHEKGADESMEFTAENYNDKISALAFWGGLRAGYYPCIVDSERSTSDGTINVLFDDDVVGSVSAETLYPLDLAVDDVVKIDVSGMRPNSYQIVGFELNSGLKSLITCKRMNVAVVRAVGANEEYRIAIGKLYIPKALWPAFSKSKKFTPAALGFQIEGHTRVSSAASEDDARMRTRTPTSIFGVSPVKSQVSPAGKSVTKNGILKGRNRGVFSEFAFTLSGYEEKERGELEGLIVRNGGWYLTNGFIDLFETGIDGIGRGMKLIARETEMKDLRFAAVISESVSRKPKVLEAVALGWPCLSKAFLVQSSREGRIRNWTKYVVRQALPAFDIAVYRMSSLWDAYRLREKPLAGKQLILVRKAGTTDTSLVSLILMMGPDVVAFTSDVKMIESIAKTETAQFVCAQWSISVETTYTIGTSAEASVERMLPSRKWDIAYLDGFSRKESALAMKAGVTIVDKDWFWRLLDV